MQGAFVSNTTADRRALVRPLLIVIVAAALVLGGIFGFHLFVGKMIKQAMSKGASAPQTVATATAQMSSWQTQTLAVGSVRAVRGADLAAQASGVVDEINFDSGNDVAAGTTLLRLKPNDDPAKLLQLQAAAELAQQSYKRDLEQLAAQAVSQATVDSDLATLKSAKAQVVAQQALIEEKVVRAPFAGRLGIRQVDLGQYLAAGTTVVSLQALDTVYVDFYVPQRALAQVKNGQAVTAVLDAYPGQRFTGAITSVNSKVDTASRNVQMRASFANPDHKLVPGMYASVLIDNGDARQEITLPQAAITYNAYGDTVFVIEHRGTDAAGKPAAVVQQRFVKLGATRGDQVAVESGLEAGDIVVSAGQLKLHNGTAVIIDNAIRPADAPAPSPPNE
jgi:membrane fusion protein (multidrug efflux system)